MVIVLVELLFCLALVPSSDGLLILLSLYVFLALPTRALIVSFLGVGLIFFMLVAFFSKFKGGQFLGFSFGAFSFLGCESFSILKVLLVSNFFT